ASPPWVRVLLASVEGPNPVWLALLPRGVPGLRRICGFRLAGVPAHRRVRGLHPLPRLRERDRVLLEDRENCVRGARRRADVDAARRRSAAPARLPAPPLLATARGRLVRQQPRPPRRRSVTQSRPKFWYHRSWGLWAIGVSGA